LFSKMKLDLVELKPGIYFVRLIIGDKQFVRKIVKE
ncbi:MAG: T9SS type A sorting domain-containing protein, partial [Bacteroidia bacterium]|nr:T9SS type A sorting domain-containing protein [Bacteroidia bacterium]